MGGGGGTFPLNALVHSTRVQYRGWDGVSSSVGVEMRWKRERVGGLRGFGVLGGMGVWVFYAAVSPDGK